MNCKPLDTEYESVWQCFVNIFINEHFSPCPIKCLPIQMKWFNYVNNSILLPNCTKLEDEICNGRPKVWNTIGNEFPKCTNPCKMVMYKDSQLELRDPTHMKARQTLANFELVMNSIKKLKNKLLFMIQMI